MKFWLSLVNVPQVDQYIEIARHAEKTGFYGITIADHLVMPTRIEQSRYPYTPDGKMWWPEDTPWPDPWVTLAAMGTATSKLMLATNIYLAALRDPFTVARAVSTTSALTGGRAIFGVSAGWIKEEYDIAGIDFASRGRRLDECIAVVKKLWTGQSVSHHGEFFQFDNALISPKPVGDVPVWSGGASAAALRRAARNDGWLGVPMTVKQLASTVEKFTALREQLGIAIQRVTLGADLLAPCQVDVAVTHYTMRIRLGAGKRPWRMLQAALNRILQQIGR